MLKSIDFRSNLILKINKQKSMYFRLILKVLLKFLLCFFCSLSYKLNVIKIIEISKRKKNRIENMSTSSVFLCGYTN